jgi:hypothetical protein
MSYTGKKNYTSRREKSARNLRYLRIFSLFLVLVIVVLIYKNRFIVKGWLESVMY